MSEPAPKPSSRQAALTFAWGLFKIYDAAATRRKKDLEWWRLRILYFTIIGAVLGTLCQALTSDFGVWLTELSRATEPLFSEDGKLHIMVKIVGVLSAVILGIGSFFSREIVNADNERNTARLRAAAEAIKSNVYLFLTRIPPYDSEDAPHLLVEKTAELKETVSELSIRQVSAEEQLADLPQDAFTLEDYIQKRVVDQANWYKRKADIFTTIILRFRRHNLILGLLAVVLGYFGVIWAAWLAVVSAVSGTLSSYIHAGNYQTLLMSYQTTGGRLDYLLARWRANGAYDQPLEVHHKLVMDAEQVMAAENSSWLAEWARKKEESGQEDDQA